MPSCHYKTDDQPLISILPYGDCVIRTFFQYCSHLMIFSSSVDALKNSSIVN